MPVTEEAESIRVSTLSCRTVRWILPGEADVIMLDEIVLTFDVRSSHLSPHYNVIADSIIGGVCGASIAFTGEINSLKAKIMNVIVRDQIVGTADIHAPAMLWSSALIGDVES